MVRLKNGRIQTENLRGNPVKLKSGWSAGDEGHGIPIGEGWAVLLAERYQKCCAKRETTMYNGSYLQLYQAFFGWERRSIEKVLILRRTSEI